MDEKKLIQFRKALSTHHDSLLDLVNTDSEETRLLLGGQGKHEVLQVVSRLNNVIQNIDKGEFAKCEYCEDEVELDRLEINCTTSVCLDHYSPDQLRDLERDLELAAKVQKQLLPCCVPSLKNVEIAFRSAPFHIVGGDYYDFFNHRSNNQGFVIADVMGKGLPASMLMSNLQASLRILGPESDELHTVMSRLNTLFCYNIRLL
jgi:serine phosphatase RsbU (regulator of sigma subunit)